MKSADLAVGCPTCGVVSGKRCKLTTGKLRTKSHPLRRVEGKRYIVMIFDPVAAQVERLLKTLNYGKGR